MKLRETVDKVLKVMDSKSPAILTGLAIAGTATLTIMNIQPKVKKIMEEHKERMDELDVQDYTDEKYNREKNKIMAGTVGDICKACLPSIAIGVATSACALGANHENTRRVAAISAAYELTSKKVGDLTEAIEDVVPKKAKEIKEKVVANNVKSEPIPTEEDYIYSTGKGDVLCKDKYTKVYFRSSMDEIERAINRMSARVRDESWVSLADLYYELGLKTEKIPSVAHDIGWHDSDCIEGNLPIMAVAALDDTGTIPVIGLDYEVDPFFKEGGRFRRS